MICATAAHHGLIVLHDDADFVTMARFLPDVSERNERNVPGLQCPGRQRLPVKERRPVRALGVPAGRPR
ncbi:hypothetical protein [Streptomyces bluensis]|uniref:hypothetical protein n=1 Tax=Streptomyces bluensis TaxID=33897 RepID=UPI003D9F5616